MRTRWVIGLMIGLLCLTGGATLASARAILQGDHCTVAAEERIDDNLFVLCRTLVIDGLVDGNLIGAATTATINGTVSGSVYLLAGRLDVNGTTGEDLHFAGATLSLNPSASFENPRSDLISVSLSTRLEEAVIPGSVTGIGYQMVLNGEIGRSVDFWGSALEVRDHINGDVDANVGDDSTTGVTELRSLLRPILVDTELVAPGLRITENAMIDGLLTYNSSSEGEILAELPNPPVFNYIPPQTLLVTEDPATTLRAYLAQVVREFVTLGTLGALLLFLTPRSIQPAILTLGSRPLPSVGVGLMTFIASFGFWLIPIGIGIGLILLLLVLRLGDLALLSSLVIGTISAGSAGLFYFVAIFISRALFCLALGSLLTRPLRRMRRPRTAWLSLLLGVLIVAFAASLPVMGWVINALAAFMGLGAIFLLVFERILANRQAAPPPPPPALESAAPQSLPPIPEDTPRPPGMDNLPEGFNWWM
jgi:hypothetical protein